jgi:hypothetical protein
MQGKIYVTTMPICGVLKHFVEDIKLQFVVEKLHATNAS